LRKKVDNSGIELPLELITVGLGVDMGFPSAHAAFGEWSDVD
jgi:hypothetical protein